MEIALALLIACLFLSLALNGVLALRIRKSKKQGSESYELKLFIRDMMADRGLLEVRRIDPANIMLRSPRDT